MRDETVQVGAGWTFDDRQTELCQTSSKREGASQESMHKAGESERAKQDHTEGKARERVSKARENMRKARKCKPRWSDSED